MDKSELHDIILKGIKLLYDYVNSEENSKLIINTAQKNNTSNAAIMIEILRIINSNAIANVIVTNALSFSDIDHFFEWYNNAAEEDMRDIIKINLHHSSKE